MIKKYLEFSYEIAHAKNSNNKKRKMHSDRLNQTSVKHIYYNGGYQLK